MKYQKKQEVKKRVLAIIALLMALIMVLSLIAPFTIFAAPVTQTTAAEAVSADGIPEDESDAKLSTFGKDKFTVELQAGFEESYIVKKAMPVFGVVTNHGQAFHGEIQLKAYTRGTGEGNEYAVYYQKLDLEQGASKAVELEVTMGNIHKYIDITLVDAKGNKVFQDFIFLTPKDPNTVMTGVLSESPQDLKYLNKLQLAKVGNGDGNATAEFPLELNRNYNDTIFLEEENFPSSVGVLNSFAVLIADDFDFSALEEAQLLALQNWVFGGGTLLLGTGASAQKTLKSLNFLSDIQMNGTEMVQEVAGVSGNITLANLAGENLLTIRQSNGQPILSLFNAGKGKVVLSHFSLSEAPMAGQEGTLGLLTQTLQATSEAALTVNVKEYENGYDSLRYIAGSFPPFNLSSVYLIFGSIIAYIIIVGPLLYFLLKKKDKREKGWIIIPGLSLFFMLLVFFLAQGSTYKNGLLNTVAVVEMQKGTSVGSAEIGLAVKSASKGEVVFTSDEKIPIEFNMEENRYGEVGEREKCAYRILSGNTTEVTFSDSQSWSTQYFKTQKNLDLGGTVESTVVMKDGKFEGEIINHTNVDFYDVALMLSGSIRSFGPLQAGGTIEVNVTNEDMANASDLFDYEKVSQQIKRREITRNDAYLRYIQDNLARQNIVMQQNMDLVPVTFFGFSDVPILEGTHRLNGKSALENSLTMYMQEFPLELSKQESFEIEFNGKFDSNAKFSQGINEYGTQVHSFEEMDLGVTYSLPTGVRIDQLALSFPTGRDSDLPQSVKLFNRSTQTWDEVISLDTIAPEDYTDGSNVVEALVYCPAESETIIPKLWIKGGGLNAGN